jgi:DNA excision repair protein ERCC-2
VSCRDYGELLVEISTSVPDGVVCFFTSYSYMERVILAWEAAGILAQVHKQTPDTKHRH